jgi:hypothetical protein
VSEESAVGVVGSNEIGSDNGSQRQDTTPTLLPGAVVIGARQDNGVGKLEGVEKEFAPGVVQMRVLMGVTRRAMGNKMARMRTD